MEKEHVQGPEGEEERLYSIKEASELTDVPPHTLRLWERKMPDFLNPKRTEGRQRRYSADCLERIRKMDYYVNHKGLSLVGARRRIDEGSDPESLQTLELKETLLADKRVRQAIDEIVELIRRRLHAEL